MQRVSKSAFWQPFLLALVLAWQLVFFALCAWDLKMPEGSCSGRHTAALRWRSRKAFFLQKQPPSGNTPLYITNVFGAVSQKMIYYNSSWPYTKQISTGSWGTGWNLFNRCSCYLHYAQHPLFENLKDPNRRLLAEQWMQPTSCSHCLCIITFAGAGCQNTITGRGDSFISECMTSFNQSIDWIFFPFTMGKRKEKCLIPSLTQTVLMGKCLPQCYCVPPPGGCGSVEHDYC